MMLESDVAVSAFPAPEKEVTPMMKYVFLPLDNAFAAATAVPCGHAGHLMLLYLLSLQQEKTQLSSCQECSCP